MSLNSNPLDSNTVNVKACSSSFGKALRASSFGTKIAWCAPNSICDDILLLPRNNRAKSPKLHPSSKTGRGPENSPRSRSKRSKDSGKNSTNKSTTLEAR